MIPLRSPRLRQLLGIGAALALLLSVYLVAAHTQRILRPTAANRGDQGSYLSYARDMYETNYQVVGGRNRMPVYPFVLSFIYEPGMPEAEFLRRAQIFNINLSAAILLVLFAIYCRHFPRLFAFALLAAAVCGAFLDRAPFVEVELLFYMISFGMFLSFWRMLVKPNAWLALWTGGLAGVAHLTKASALPAVALFVFTFLAKSAWEQRSAGPPRLRLVARQALLLALVLGTFLAVVFPYIRTSKRVFGHYFYNVNSTFYMWCDSWEEAKSLTRAHGDRVGWPRMPPQQIPSAAKYWQEHSVAQIVGRVGNGLIRLAVGHIEVTRHNKYLVLLACVAGALAFRKRTEVREIVRLQPWAVVFLMSFFVVYAMLFAWWVPLSADPRFLLMLFLPFTFAASKLILRLGRGTHVSVAGRTFAVVPAVATVLLIVASADATFRAAALREHRPPKLEQVATDSWPSCEGSEPYFAAGAGEPLSTIASAGNTTLLVRRCTTPSVGER